MTSKTYLNVGCGNVKIPGFVNIDLEPGGDIQCDVTRDLPYSDAVVDGIYSEHFVEYLAQNDIISFLRECRRVLKPGGRVRIATPDLKALVTEYANDDWRQPWLEKYGYSWIKSRAEYLNICMREMGHKWLVDEEELSRLAGWAGLVSPERCLHNKSGDPYLAGRETCGESTLIMEYVKQVESTEAEPLVSIVIPAYRADFLVECLDSALSQSYRRTEIIVLDDCPTDAVKDIAEGYMLRNTNVVYLRNSTALGEPDNLTQGIRLARGAFVKPLYDDDVLESHAVEQLLNLFRANPDIKLAAGRRLPIDVSGKVLDDGVLGTPLAMTTGRLRGTQVIGAMLSSGINNLGEPTCMLFRRSDALNIDEHNVMTLFGRLCFGAGDVCLSMHLLSRGDLAYLVDPVARFRIHAGQTQQQMSRKLALDSWNYMRDQAIRLGFEIDITSPKPGQLKSSAHLLSTGKPQGSGTAVLLHLYYPELWHEIFDFLKNLPPPRDVYISLSEGREDVLADIIRDIPEAVVIRHPNRGRDIAPRLELLRLARSKNYTNLLFIHGKKSPHLRELENVYIPFLRHKDGDRWRRELFSTLFDSAGQVIAAFEQQPKLGLIGPYGFWLSLAGDPLVARMSPLAQRMGISVDTARHGFFAGSMFWCRPEALDPLLALNLETSDFEEEDGQTDGTLAHVIERLFTLSVERAGFQISDTAGNLMMVPPKPMLPWLPESRCLPAEQEWVQERIAGWQSASQPLPALALVLVPNAAGQEQSTQSSLAAQWQDSVKLISLSPSSEAGELLTTVNAAMLDAHADWLGLIDAGDQLAPDAIFRIQQAIAAHPERQVIYTDEDSLTADGQHVNPHCKPDFNIDYLRSLPYIGGLLLIKKELFAALGGFDPAADGAEDYDLVLRAWEQVGDEGIGHIPEVLYHRLQGGGHCNKSIEEILAASKGALERHLQRLGIAAEVLPGPFPPSTRVRYPLTATPLVSIIIPTRNQVAILQRCVESIIEKTRYPHYEILIVDNDSDEVEARNYLDLLSAQEESLGGRLRVLRHPGPFNFSAMNNRAVEEARGDLILLLNNDTAALHEDWLEEMVSHALRPEVGIVGAKLLFPDGKIQHAGVILGMRGPAEHPFIGQPAEYRGYFGRAMLTQDLSAVTGACLLVSKALYRDVGGLDEERFQVSYNDVDLCLKVRELGKKIVFTPWAILMHEGSASQRGEVEKKPSPEKEKRFVGEKMAFYRKWLPQLAFDPAYNRHFSLASTDFLLEDQAALTWDPDWRPRPRILVHPADREGCGEYRIISPMRALQQAGRVQGWETMRIFEPAEMERFSPDSIVVQRQMEWPQIEALERHKGLSKAFRVFEIDDLITNLPVKSLHKAHIHKDIAKRFRKAAGLCNRLVVATEPLAQAYKGFSDEVRVQPNCIEAAIWGALRPQRRGGAKPRVGWAGGVGHTGDLEMIADVVRDLANEVEWVFFGLCPDALRPYVHEVHSGVPLPQYPAKLASLDLDLALAPLEDNPFNEAKSHLRILEYGILGYPVICSDVFPYQGDFPVVRVNNRYRDWIKAIREAISDRETLAQTGDRLREQVRKNWLLEEHLDDWLKVWLP